MTVRKSPSSILKYDSWMDLPSIELMVFSGISDSVFLVSIYEGLSNSTVCILPSSNASITVNVEYARFLTEHTGRVLAMVSTVSSRLAPSFSIVTAILAVRVASMLAFTPLPRPSDITIISLSPTLSIATWSPHSSSPCFLRLLYAVSRNNPIYSPSMRTSSLSLSSAIFVSAVVSPRRLAISCAAVICLSITFCAILSVLSFID